MLLKGWHFFFFWDGGAALRCFYLLVSWDLLGLRPGLAWWQSAGARELETCSQIPKLSHCRSLKILAGILVMSKRAKMCLCDALKAPPSPRCWEAVEVLVWTTGFCWPLASMYTRLRDMLFLNGERKLKEAKFSLRPEKFSIKRYWQRAKNGQVGTKNKAKEPRRKEVWAPSL